jgi:hypothetical protein
MAAVAQVHAEHLVAGLQDRGVDGEICLRAGVRLHVRMLRAKKPFRPIDGEVLHPINLLASAVPPPARISLGVLVREHAALCLHHGRVREILGRDQLDVTLLATELRDNHGMDLRVEGTERRGCDGHRISGFGLHEQAA